LNTLPVIEKFVAPAATCTGYLCCQFTPYSCPIRLPRMTAFDADGPRTMPWQTPLVPPALGVEAL
jgi:hypothetical protein